MRSSSLQKLMNVLTLLMLSRFHHAQTRYKSLIQQHKENHELHTRLLQERQASQDEDARIQEVRFVFHLSSHVSTTLRPACGNNSHRTSGNSVRSYTHFEQKISSFISP